MQKYQLLTEENIQDDESIFSMEQLKPNKLWIGWGLIIIGGYSLFDHMTQFLGWQFQYMFKNALAAITLIILGWFLVSGKTFSFHRKAKEDK
ncbi:hypothetical protein [Tepidibacillus marianensis]|uniref:hypothetical protein n=1 Tax=Tepidibacillus marianensis TaxID=3131995 RepID=UPI0030CE9441